MLIRENLLAEVARLLPEAGNCFWVAASHGRVWAHQAGKSVNSSTKSKLLRTFSPDQSHAVTTRTFWVGGANSRKREVISVGAEHAGDGLSRLGGAGSAGCTPDFV